MVTLTLFLDIDGVLNTPPMYGKKIESNNVTVFNKLIDELCKKYEVEIVLSSSWRLSSGVNRTLREAGITAKLRGVTQNLGDRNKEINTYIENNNLQKQNCLVLDDEKDIVKDVVCNYYITNYKTGLVNNDINRILKTFN